MAAFKTVSLNNNRRGNICKQKSSPVTCEEVGVDFTFTNDNPDSLPTYTKFGLQLTGCVMSARHSWRLYSSNFVARQGCSLLPALATNIPQWQMNISIRCSFADGLRNFTWSACCVPAKQVRNRLQFSANWSIFTQSRKTITFTHNIFFYKFQHIRNEARAERLVALVAIKYINLLEDKMNKEQQQQKLNSNQLLCIEFLRIKRQLCGGGLLNHQNKCLKEKIK